ncbi:MAG TPA: GNAT family N-acetyltransferase [Gaiellaceae bacterium]|nr:GNAT family N-acetyltransferase [Gaiellaceae bacterium]
MLRLEQIDAARVPAAEWDGLALASRNLFATREFLTLWWSHFGRGHRPLLIACREGDGRLVALLPLYLRRHGPLGTVRFLGHGPADLLGPVCGPEWRAQAGDAVARAASAAGADVLLAEHVPAAERSEAWLASGRVVRDEAFPLVRAASWDEYVGSRSGHFRKKLAWQERRLGRDGRVEYRLTDAGSLERDLETLFALHRARWKTQTDFLSRASFYRELAAAALTRGWLRMWQLELDGAAVASIFGFRFAGREWHVQTGRDPSIKAVSTGLLLLWQSLRAAVEEGVGEYLLLRGPEDYKYRVATDDPRIATVARPLTALGRAALLAGAAADRLGPLRALARRGVGRA